MYVNSRKTVTAIVLGVASTILIISAVYLAGCTNTLEGDVYDNQKPIVSFVNIPPDGQDFSTNPVINWYGVDNDGLISYYRYHIATASAIGDMTPENYIKTLSDEVFITCDTTVIACDTVLSEGTACDTLDADTVYVLYCDTIADW
ncbi:MAG: hypothetical protein DRP47_04505, partial [Candidatus Zixiibacteriota bacterium]